MSASLNGVDVRRLRLKPGDHIVLRTSKPISPRACMDIKKAAEERWPDYPITILNDLAIDVLADGNS